MIHRLHLGNFKAFAETQSIPIRPLTLIYGPNSAGKSSIIHSLALAHHALETGELDTHRTGIGGESIDLGGFRQYVHRRDVTRAVEWTAELDASRFSGRTAELLAAANRAGLHVSIGKSERLGIAIQSIGVLIDGAEVMSMSARAPGRLQVDRLDQHHPALRRIFTALLEAQTSLEAWTDRELNALDSAIDSIVPELQATAPRLVPRLRTTTLREEEDAQALMLPVSRSSREDDIRGAVQILVPRLLRELVDGISAAVEGALKKLQYLGPLRWYPPRHLSFSPHEDPSWRSGGGSAWDVLRQNPNVRERVNRWLMDAHRLSTPYEIVVRQLVAPEETYNELWEALDEIHDSLIQDVDLADLDPNGEAEGVDKLSNWDPDVFVQLIQQKLRSAAEQSTVTELVLLDRRTNTVVSHRDVGIGISQVLPVLVNAYSMSGQLIAIEQPEIHLHPALQAELADVFIESALGPNRNTFMLESHSEHLLLRLMKRMRQTSDGELRPGCHPVRPSDVSILFVDPQAGAGSIVRHLELDAEGKLLDPWPGGFFEEGFRERFGD